MVCGNKVDINDRFEGVDRGDEDEDGDGGGNWREDDEGPRKKSHSNAIYVKKIFTPLKKK